MATALSVFKTKNLEEYYSSDNSYNVPISLGSIGSPLDGKDGDISQAIPLWIKNTGDETLFNTTVTATSGSTNAKGGTPSNTAGAFIELALDDNSNLPNQQQNAPTSYQKVEQSSDSATIILSNIIDTDGNPKSETFFGEDDDCRTMLPGEYAIIWLRCNIDAQRSVGQSLPTDFGIKNIKLSITGMSAEIVQEYGALSVFSTICVIVEGYTNFGGRIYIGTLVSQWHMDEGSGMMAYDSRGLSNGVISDAVWWNIGIENKSLSFDGNAVINCGNANNLNPGANSFSIDVWFKSEYLGYGGGIVEKIDSSKGYKIELVNNFIRVHLGDNLGNNLDLDLGSDLNDSGWHYICIVIDRTNNLMNILVDKIAVVVNYDISNITGIIENNEDFKIGRGFIGRIDEIAFYNRILSNSEVDVKYDTLWNVYLGLYGVTDDGELILDSNGRAVVDEIY